MDIIGWIFGIFLVLGMIGSAINSNNQRNRTGDDLWMIIGMESMMDDHHHPW